MKPPSAFAISFATEGFSAMMRVLVINWSRSWRGAVAHSEVFGRPVGGVPSGLLTRKPYKYNNLPGRAANDKRVAAKTASEEESAGGAAA
ncbi:hypothetical protein NCCP691_22260 [Noviherbaspirillum aridicola]|uniref:Uncharacterized protein n=1 Tax=Noviherbaspirillum aridicola TaxID=2849687 RepID=A0ABQ4Q4T9_9BURK|nr:hypothetical protein NCCP691_22260 [Noviherbaspirillum aridicola]